MKYLFCAAFILLLDYSMSQDVQVPCKETRDCQYLTNASTQVTCSGGYCKCLDDHGIPRNCGSVNMTQLMEAHLDVGGLIGRTCSLEKDCSVVDINAFCNTTRKQCACNRNFVPSTDNQRCLPAVQYNNSGCEIANQCLYLVGNSTCSNGVCLCDVNHHYTSGSCWAMRDFGSNCSVTTECSHVQDAICDDQFRCDCPVDRVAVTSVTDPRTTACFLQVSKLEDECVQANQCTRLMGENSVCVDHHCKCREHHHQSMNTSKCLPDLDLGADCQANDQCSNGDGESSHGPMQCLANKCVCVEDFEVRDGKCQAVERSNKVSAARGFADMSTFAMALASVILLSSVL